MVDSAIRDQLLRELSRLPTELQRRVLSFAESLVANPGDTPGLELLAFAGTLPSADAQEMVDAIQAGCETVDPRDW